MPVEWALSIVVPIYKGKGDIKICSCEASCAWYEGGGKGDRKKAL